MEEEMGEEMAPNLGEEQQPAESGGGGKSEDVISYTDQVEKVLDGMKTAKTDWPAQLEKIRNGVVQLRIVQEQFMWSMPYRAPMRETIFGSGWFIDNSEFGVDTGDDMLIVTNAHVLKQASSITILIPELGKEPIAGEAVGVCVQRDIAIARVKNPKEVLKMFKERTGEADIVRMKMGDSDIMNRGAPVMAVGYPLGMQSIKASVGIVSGYQQFKKSLYLSITAPINPGNSGGPLYNSDGEVVGINSAKFAKASGIAFAIPTNQVRVALDALYSAREFIEPEIGITTSVGTADLNEYLTGLKSKDGVYVKDVMPDGLYADAGGASGDLLLAIDGHKVDRFGKVWMEQLKDRLSTAGLLLRHPLGTEIAFHVYRADTVGKGKLIKLSTIYKFTKRPAVHFLYEPIVDRPKFVTFAGFVFVKLNLNLVESHMDDNPEELVQYMEPINRNKDAVIISNVIPASLAHNDGSAKKGLLVKEINGMKINTMDELCAALSSNVDPKQYWTLSTSKTFTAFKVEQVLDYEKGMMSSRLHSSPFHGCHKSHREQLETAFLSSSK
jgi:S1-C subfamily serine protease